jgi:DnaJ domain
MTELPLVVDQHSQHHVVLDLPVDASPDQIKNQYKLLVRIYHPDRYQDARTRSYAGHKLKRINQAYSALVKRARALPVEPRPLAYNSQLDFGVMAEKSIQTLYFQIENFDGVVQNARLTLSEENSWFHVSAGVSLLAGTAFPMQFAVVADTSQLAAGQAHQGWIDIQINELAVRVAVTVAVAAPPVPVLPYGYTLPALLFLLIVALLVGRNSIARQLNAIQPVAEPAAQPKTISLVKSQALPVDLSTCRDTGQANVTVQRKIVHKQAAALSVVAAPAPTTSARPQSMPTPTPVAASEPPAATTLTVRKIPPRPFASVLIIIPDDYNVHARFAPLVTATEVRLLPAGTQWFAVGRTPDNSWLSILLADQQTAWILAETIQVEADRLKELPLIATDLD